MSKSRSAPSRLTTVRLVVLITVTSALVLFTIQNRNPALPLTVLGARTQTYPLAVWLTGSILAGALTTLLLTWAVAPSSRKATRRGQPRGDWGRDRPRSPAGSDRGTSRQSPESSTGFANFDPRDANPNADRQPNRTVADSHSDINAQDWGSFRPRETWNDWEQGPDPDSPTPASVRDQRRVEKERQKKRKDPRYAANESFEDIAQGWDNWDERTYQPRGASPIDDTLADIEEGWEDYGDDYGVYPGDSGDPAYDDSVYGDSAYDDSVYRSDPAGPQAPKTVYQDGSIYGDRYQDDPQFQDHPRAPERDYPRDYSDDADRYADVEDDRSYEDDYAYEDGVDTANDTDTASDDDVYDADYRVIIPPYRPLDGEDDNADDAR